MEYLSFTALLLLAASAAAQKPVTLRPCAGREDYPAFKNVTINPCDREPCVIKTGERYNITFYAEAVSDTDRTLLVVTETQQSDTTYVQLVRKLRCDIEGFTCTASQGDLLRGSLLFTVNSAFSAGRHLYELELVGDMDWFACGETELMVV
ncbi:uncharacterized protein LOC144162101 [Haemaphysalis longicornis]